MPPETKSPEMKSAPSRPALDGIPNELVDIIIDFVRTGDSTYLLRYDRNLANLSRTCWKFWKMTCRLRYWRLFMTDKEWPIKDSKLAEPALDEVRIVFIKRRHNPNDFFTDHGMDMLRKIPKDQLRTVRFHVNPIALCPTDILDHLFKYQRNLNALDLRWQLSYTYHLPVTSWRPSISGTLTSLTVRVHCYSEDYVAQVTAEILASCCNLEELTAYCCVHPRRPGMADMFDVTAHTLFSRGLKLRLKALRLIGACPAHVNSPEHVNSTNQFCNVFRDIVDFSDLDSLCLVEAMEMPSDFLWMIVNLNQGHNIREVYIQWGKFRSSAYSIPYLPSLEEFLVTERNLSPGMGGDWPSGGW